jgi:hypothetical protein
MKNENFSVDIENLRKAYIAPAILAGLLGFSPFPGAFWLPLFVFLGTISGISYMNTVLKIDQNFDMMQIGFNASLLAGAAYILYDVSSILKDALFYQTWNFGSFSVFIFPMLTEAFIGLLAAFAWYVYQNEKKNL